MRRAHPQPRDLKLCRLPGAAVVTMGQCGERVQAARNGSSAVSSINRRMQCFAATAWGRGINYVHLTNEQYAK